MKSKKKKSTTKKTDLLCYDCCHSIKSHTEHGCKQCDCKLKDYDYNSLAADDKKQKLVVELESQLEVLENSLQRLSSVRQRVDDFSTAELKEQLKGGSNR